jgi:hypothetical protein
VGNDLLLAIDPGPEQSAFVLYNVLSYRPHAWAKIPNDELLTLLDDTLAESLAIEMIASYGMPVGAEVFETCVWIGRFTERWRTSGIRRCTEVRRVTRIQVKSHLCHSAKANDSNVRAALIDRYGPGKEKAIGLKAGPGPLYGLTGDCWAALGVAITATETPA